MKKFLMGFAPWVVYASWGKTRMHLAWSYESAVQWALSYPADANATIVNLFDI